MNIINGHAESSDPEVTRQVFTKAWKVDEFNPIASYISQKCSSGNRADMS